MLMVTPPSRAVVDAYDPVLALDDKEEAEDQTTQEVLAAWQSRDMATQVGAKAGVLSPRSAFLAKDRLDLSAKSLEAVPTYVGKLDSLRELSLVGNGLVSLSSLPVRKLPNLEILNCGANRLSDLPDLSNLPLVHLGLSYNRLQSLCAIAHKLPAPTLRVLDLSFNQLDSLPETTEALCGEQRFAALYALNLAGNLFCLREDYRRATRACLGPHALPALQRLDDEPLSTTPRPAGSGASTWDAGLEADSPRSPSKDAFGFKLELLSLHGFPKSVTQRPRPDESESRPRVVVEARLFDSMAKVAVLEWEPLPAGDASDDIPPMDGLTPFDGHGAAPITHGVARTAAARDALVLPAAASIRGVRVVIKVVDSARPSSDAAPDTALDEEGTEVAVLPFTFPALVEGRCTDLEASAATTVAPPRYNEPRHALSSSKAYTISATARLSLVKIRAASAAPAGAE